ncbi:VOC family protein [Brucella thiophenivorans]|uniref:Glyoxalase/fosfomycin resistance/dioxygenase domain-containing protein n=1 Tax=Brucella thiophenivorans TaxID=571255 RepID=A0A256FZR4_9HYPH|nr:VOC family protein [Brucella thiophenivorans]OYR20309.1 hypothetical protein CEV31_1735 [Brucella thiophenivorans]
MNIIVHVETPVTDIHLAIAFYEKIFGVTFGEIIEIYGIFSF